MALLHLEGFETRQHFSYFTRIYDSTITTGSVTSYPEGRKVGSAAQASNCVMQTVALVSSPENTWIVGFGLHMVSASATTFTIHNAAGTAQLAIVCAAGTTPRTFTISVKRGSTTLATSGEFLMGMWHFFELKATVRTSTNGSYELRRNGVNVLSASGVNTADTGVDGASVVSWSWGGASTRLDDIYICDSTGSAFNDFLGDKVIVGSLPSSAGASTQWLPSTSTNVSCVDDAADNPQTDYVSSNTDGDLDLYNFADLSTVAADGTIDAVMVAVSCSMLNSGGRGLKVRFRDSGGTTADSAQFDVTLKTEVRTFPVIFEQEPVAASAWTVAGFNAGQFGPLNYVEL